MLYNKRIYMINASSACTTSDQSVIGYRGSMPWEGLIPSDMVRFKKLTMYHSVIMGRKTWDSLNPKFKPLPQRQNIIMSRNPDLVVENGVPMENLVSSPYEVVVTNSFERAVGTAKFQDVWVIGGAEIYRLALPFADYLHQTLIEEEFDGDTFWPDEYNPNEWEEIDSTFCIAGNVRNPKDKLDYWYRISQRKFEQNAA